MSNSYLGVYRGTVMANDDPADMMRIKVLVPEVLGEEQSGWALPCVPPGVRSVPDVAACVWIVFEAGDPSRPIWIGTTGGAFTGVVTQK